MIWICETKSLDELCELASGTDESVKAEVKYEGTDEEKVCFSIFKERY